MTRGTKYAVLVNQRTTQGYRTKREAVEEVARAHRRGRQWDVMVRGPGDFAFRTLTRAEVTDFVKAVTKELTKGA